MWEPSRVFIMTRGAPWFGFSCRTTDESCVLCNCIREALCSTFAVADCKHCVCLHATETETSGHQTHFLIHRMPRLNERTSVSLIHPTRLLSNVYYGLQPTTLKVNVCLRRLQFSFCRVHLVAPKDQQWDWMTLWQRCAVIRQGQWSWESAAEWWNREVRQRW